MCYRTVNFTVNLQYFGFQDLKFILNLVVCAWSLSVFLFTWSCVADAHHQQNLNPRVVQILV